MSNALFGLHGEALRLRGERMTLIASNIANAATPGLLPLLSLVISIKVGLFIIS